MYCKIELKKEDKERKRTKKLYMTRKLEIKENGFIVITYIDGNGVENKEYYTKNEILELEITE